MLEHFIKSWKIGNKNDKDDGIKICHSWYIKFECWFGLEKVSTATIFNSNETDSTARKIQQHGDSGSQRA